MIREIVLDIETSGWSPKSGHRIIEIGCVELDDHIPTGRVLQLYINPERDISEKATEVHGITDEFVKDKPIFLEIYEEFNEFIGDASLVIHNSKFDMRFINSEFDMVGRDTPICNNIIDTLQIARRRFQGSRVNLNALCRRFGIDNSERDKHGALLDAELLSEVYQKLLGGSRW